MNAAPDTLTSTITALLDREQVLAINLGRDAELG